MHAVTNIKQEMLVELSHTPLAIFGVLAGWARGWNSGCRGKQYAGKYLAWVWPVCFYFRGIDPDGLSRGVAESPRKESHEQAALGWWMCRDFCEGGHWRRPTRFRCCRRCRIFVAEAKRQAR